MESEQDLDAVTKDAILNTLADALSPCSSKRNNAESRLKAFEVLEGYGTHLTSITLDDRSGIDSGIRHLASVLLHQYVESHWCSASAKFQKPETADDVKRVMRSALPKGLADAESKVRSSVAYAVASIAAWDWPDQWPDLVQVLVNHSGASPEFAQGSMQVLVDMADSVGDEHQLQDFAPTVLPHLYRVFAEKDKYSTETRLGAVTAFMRMVKGIVKLAELDRDIPKIYLYPVVPSYAAALVSTLGQPVALELRASILSCLEVLVRHCPKLMSCYAVQVLSPVWQALTQCADVYCQGSSGEHGDGLQSFIFALFNFVGVLIESGRFRDSVLSSLPELMYYVFKYMQMTEEQIAVWSVDVERFVEDEDEESFTYSIRIAAQCLLLNLFEDLGKGCRDALIFGLQRHLEDAGKMKEANPQGGWWKVHESAYLAVGVVHTYVVNAESSHFLRELVENFVLPDLSIQMFPFLHGRCLWLSSRLAKVMPIPIARTFLAATVDGLGEGKPLVVRASAANSIYGFAQCKEIAMDLRQCLPQIVDKLVQLASTAGTDTLSMILEQLPHCLSADEVFAAEVEPKVTALTMHVMTTHSSDPVLASLCEELFCVLAKNRRCAVNVERTIVPMFIPVLRDSAMTSPKTSRGVKKVMLEVLRCVVRASDLPLSDRLMNDVFPAVVDEVLETDDDDAPTVVAGCECLRAFVSVSPSQVGDWTDPRGAVSGSGSSGLDRLVHVSSRLLNIRTSENCGAVVGRLLTVMFTKCGSLMAPTLVDHLLKAVLSKMTQCQTQTVMQTLLMVYAYVMYHRLEVGLDFLNAVPGPHGKSALDYVMIEWCSRHHFFMGSYATKVSAVALLRVLEHGIRTEDKRLASIVFVDGDGRLKPVLLKIFSLMAEQLVVCEALRTAKQNAGSALNTSSSAAMDDTDQGWESTDEEDEDDAGYDVNRSQSTVESQQILTLDQALTDGSVRKLAWMAMNDGECESVDDDESHDPDVAADPLNSLDLEKVLAQHFREFSRLPFFPTFLSELGPRERRCVDKRLAAS